MQVKNYWKTEFDKKFLRTEISICRKSFNTSRVNHLDDLMYNYSKPLNRAFKSFKLAKINRKKVSADLRIPDRFLNKYKDLPAKHMALLIFDLHRNKFKNFEEFRRKYVEFYPLTDDLHEMSREYFQDTFFAVDPFLKKELNKQRKVELKIKKKFKRSVAEAKKRAREYMDERLLDRVRTRILREIERLILKPEIKGTCYQGMLDGFIFGLDRVVSLINKDKKAQKLKDEEDSLNDSSVVVCLPSAGPEANKLMTDILMELQKGFAVAHEQNKLQEFIRDYRVATLSIN